MAKKPVKSLKTTSDEYARLIMSGCSDKERIRLLRNKLGFPDEYRKPDDDKKSSKIGSIPKKDRVGIWKAELINDQKCYVRDPECVGEFHFWAKTEKIFPKRDKFRIAYMGESVARGFLYDPFFTPASHLESLLNVNLEDKKVEVVDLARTNQRIEELIELCSSCISLEPDALVIFAGNNWRESLYFTDGEIKEIIESMDCSERLERIRAIIEKKYDEMITCFMYSLNDIAKRRNIPVVMLIPEFNLKGWKSNSYDRTLTFAKGMTGKWLQLKKRAQAAILHDDIDSAETLAAEMIGINKANPLGYEIMADCKLKKGMPGEARKYLELEMDTSMFRLNTTPVCISYIRRLIVEKSQELGFRTVNIPEAFNEYLHGDIPGNDLFLDYCHMTAEGIHIAMNYTANCLLPLIEDKQAEIKDIKCMSDLPNKEITGNTHFFAAVHCTHRGDQSYEILYHNCLIAVQSSKNSINLIKNYIDIATRKIPWTYNKNYEFLVKEGLASQYSVLMQPKDCMIMDICLVQAAIDALKTIGIDIKNEVDLLRLDEHSVKDQKVSLLETYYRESSYINSSISGNVLIDRSYISVTDVISSFFLIADKKSDLKFDLTFRISGEELAENEVTITINGMSVSKTMGSKKWKDISFTVSKDIFKEDGVNMIEIEWPLIDSIEEGLIKEYEKKYDGLELFIRKSRPIYAEIMRFDVRQSIIY